MNKESHVFDISFIQSSDVYGQIMPYVGISVNYTSVSGFIRIDDASSSISNEGYFIAKQYEEKYGTSSEEMLKKWRTGEWYGTDITDWIMNYMTVRDRIYDAGAPQYSH